MTRGLGYAVVLAALLVAPVAGQSDDPVGAYLERLGLNQLLAVHLEELLEQATTSDEREGLQLRLVSLYAQLVNETDDPALRAVLEERSLRLLATASEEAGLELQIALLRARYRTVEQIAENHRLRMADPAEVERARQTLPEIIRELNDLRGRIEQQLRAADNRLARATGVEAAVLTDRADELARMKARTAFLSAWALYYQSWLHGRPDNARVAEGLFAELLLADGPRPEPEDVSEDLRSDEAIARTILGMALCKSLTGSSATAVQWLELLAHPSAFLGVRDEVPAWKMVVHLEHGEFREARQVLVEYQVGGSEVPLPWLRLAAVHAMEAEVRSRSASELARESLAALAARGELAQVLELSDRYGPDALGDQGFAFRYVRGVQVYQRVRESHGDDEPTSEPMLVMGYTTAAGEFSAALAEPDIDAYPGAAADCRSLLAFCWYFQGRFREAREAFELAAANMPPDEAEEAIWMAIVSLDQVVQAGEADPALERELWSLIDGMLARYPNSQHADKLILKRAIGRGEFSPQVVEELLSIAPGSDTYDAAQQRAAYTLYRLFRESRGESRVGFGNEYLAIALPLVARGALTIDPGDAQAVDQHVARCRRVLEVAMTDGIERVVAAANVLSDLEELQRLHGVDLEAYREEFDFRRVQQHLHGGQVAAAGVIADRLHDGDPESIWTRLANRALFEDAVVEWRGDERGVDMAVLARVIRYGDRIIEEYVSDPDARQRSGVLAYWLTVAEAHFRRWERSGDPGAGTAALKLYEQVLGARENDASSLRAVALLSEDLGDPERALECWRILANGSRPGTHVWYESKFRLISLLLEVDAARARAVMDQHKALNPSLGPEPWASRFKALDERLFAAPAQEGGDGG